MATGISGRSSPCVYTARRASLSVTMPTTRTCSAADLSRRKPRMKALFAVVTALGVLVGAVVMKTAARGPSLLVLPVLLYIGMQIHLANLLALYDRRVNQ